MDKIKVSAESIKSLRVRLETQKDTVDLQLTQRDLYEILGNMGRSLSIYLDTYRTGDTPWTPDPELGHTIALYNYLRSKVQDKEFLGLIDTVLEPIIATLRRIEKEHANHNS